jgi:hypothetical protein
VGQGRLGNHLFQYAALNALMGVEDKVLFIDNGLFQLIDNDFRFIRIPCPIFIRKYINYFLYVMLLFFVKVRFFGSVSETACSSNDSHSETNGFIYKSGLLNNVYLLNGFFQYSYLSKVQFKIKSDLDTRAKELLSRIPSKGVLIAVHIRLTDYKNWIVYGKKGADLPISYYIDCIARAKSMFKNPVFVIFTDDLKYVNTLNFGVDFHSIPLSSELLDFAAISGCDHAIISASTYSWWAAILNIEITKNKIIFAPKYWAGFKSEKWFPPYIESEKLLYVDVI